VIFISHRIPSGTPFTGPGDVIVNRIPETLLAPEVSLRRLDGDVTQQKLNLLQFAACLMAESCTGPPQIRAVRRLAGRSFSRLPSQLPRSPWA